MNLHEAFVSTVSMELLFCLPSSSFHSLVGARVGHILAEWVWGWGGAKP